jgi:hypothetical protein
MNDYTLAGTRPDAQLITIHKPEDYESMRTAGRLAAEILDFITPYVKPDVTTGELDRLCHDFTIERGAIPGISQIHLHLDQPRGLPRHSR